MSTFEILVKICPMLGTIFAEKGVTLTESTRQQVALTELYKNDLAEVSVECLEYYIDNTKHTMSASSGTKSVFKRDGIDNLSASKYAFVKDLLEKTQAVAYLRSTQHFREKAVETLAEMDVARLSEYCNIPVPVFIEAKIPVKKIVILNSNWSNSRAVDTVEKLYLCFSSEGQAAIEGFYKSAIEYESVVATLGKFLNGSLNNSLKGESILKNLSTYRKTTTPIVTVGDISSYEEFTYRFDPDLKKKKEEFETWYNNAMSELNSLKAQIKTTITELDRKNTQEYNEEYSKYSSVLLAENQKRINWQNSVEEYRTQLLTLLNTLHIKM